MLTLIKRCPQFVDGYRAYCQEAFDAHERFFIPTDPARIDGTWFLRTKDWYDRKETGQVAGQPTGFHYWAVDGDQFIGEFQLRTQFTEQVLTGIGSVGYAVRVSKRGRGYGTALLQQGLKLAKAHGMEKVLLNIHADNAVSLHICEKLGGVRMDTIRVSDGANESHAMHRYWILLS